jgi:hypothetical protein
MAPRFFVGVYSVDALRGFALVSDTRCVTTHETAASLIRFYCFAKKI